MKGGDLVLFLQLFLCQINLIVTQFCERPRFADWVGFTLILCQVLSQAVLCGERDAERQRRNYRDSHFNRDCHLGGKKSFVLGSYFFLDCPSSRCKTRMRWRA